MEKICWQSGMWVWGLGGIRIAYTDLGVFIALSFWLAEVFRDVYNTVVKIWINVRVSTSVKYSWCIKYPKTAIQWLISLSQVPWILTPLQCFLLPSKATRWGWAGGWDAHWPQILNGLNCISICHFVLLGFFLCCTSVWHAYVSLFFDCLLAVSDKLSLLPATVNSEPFWELRLSTCLSCWRLFWELHKSATWVYERKMGKNTIFTHNNSTSPVGLASSEFSRRLRIICLTSTWEPNTLDIWESVFSKKLWPLKNCHLPLKSSQTSAIWCGSAY